MSFRSYSSGHALGSREMATLLCVADEGSLRRAALALGISATAVSKTVRQAEARLGAPVFERSSGGARLTGPGQALLVAGREALLALGAAEQAFRAGSLTLSGLVRIGCGPIPAPAVARIVVPEARRRWPALRLTIELGYPAELIRAITQGRIDVALCHIEDVALPPGLVCQHIQTLHSVVLVRAGHPLLGGGPVSPTAIGGYGLAGFTYSARFLQWYREQTGRDADIAFVGPDFDSLAETVADSDLLLFSSRFVATGIISRYGLVALPVAWEGFSHHVHCLTPARAHSPASDAVIALIRELLPQSEASTSG